MKRIILASTFVLAALLSEFPASASQTITTLKSKYTSWTVGPGVYWNDEDGHYSDTSESQIGHSPGVAFSLPDLPAGTLVDIDVIDETQSLGLGPLSGTYVFHGPWDVVYDLSLPPFDYHLTLYNSPILARGNFCGSISAIEVPAGAVDLFVSGEVPNENDGLGLTCAETNPGSQGIVTATLWTP